MAKSRKRKLKTEGDALRESHTRRSFKYFDRGQDAPDTKALSTLYVSLEGHERHWSAVQLKSRSKIRARKKRLLWSQFVKTLVDSWARSRVRWNSKGVMRHANLVEQIG